MGNLVWRMHYAHRELSHEGRPTGVYYGFLRTIWDLRKNISKRLVFCWDGKQPYWRSAIFPEYKANRKKEDAERKLVFQQIPGVHRLIRYLGYCDFEFAHLEADDLISLLANRLEGPILIFSTDRDLYQCLSDRDVKVLKPKKLSVGGYKVFSSADVKKEFSVDPAYWDAYLAMGGDSSDNIKPQRGMGPKTALRLLNAGADPACGFEDQIDSFQEEFSAYKSIWHKVELAYQVASLPRFVGDLRIIRYLRSCELPRSLPKQCGNLKLFSGFCANYGLLDALSKRYSYFD